MGRRHRHHRRRHHHTNYNSGFDFKWVIILLIILLIGFYGGQKTSTGSYNCDIGFEGTFCVWWHQTPFGEFDELMSEGYNWLYGG